MEEIGIYELLGGYIAAHKWWWTSIGTSSGWCWHDFTETETLRRLLSLVADCTTDMLRH